MFPKTNSAPPRVTSKFINSKTIAKKEIEAWVKKDADPLTGHHETSRMAGQFIDNITEERMLKSKLWQLSKERYKFIAQNSYEKKIFLDRMMRKSSAIRRVMSATENNKNKVTQYTKIRPDTVCNALLERIDPTKNEDTWLGIQAHKSPHSTNFITSIPPDTSGSHISVNSFESLTGIDQKSKPFQQDRLLKLLNADERELLPIPTANRQIKLPRNFNEDPRYYDLQHRLCPVVRKHPNVDVYSVVTKIESLHVQPKVHKKEKPKLDKKALAYMRKRGFVFP